MMMFLKRKMRASGSTPTPNWTWSSKAVAWWTRARWISPAWVCRREVRRGGGRVAWVLGMSCRCTLLGRRGVVGCLGGGGTLPRLRDWRRRPRAGGEEVGGGGLGRVWIDESRYGNARGEEYNALV